MLVLRVATVVVVSAGVHPFGFDHGDGRRAHQVGDERLGRFRFLTVGGIAIRLPEQIFAAVKSRRKHMRSAAIVLFAAISLLPATTHAGDNGLSPRLRARSF